MVLSIIQIQPLVGLQPPYPSVWFPPLCALRHIVHSLRFNLDDFGFEPGPPNILDGLATKLPLIFILVTIRENKPRTWLSLLTNSKSIASNSRASHSCPSSFFAGKAKEVAHKRHPIPSMEMFGGHQSQTPEAGYIEPACWRSPHNYTKLEFGNRYVVILSCTQMTINNPIKACS